MKVLANLLVLIKVSELLFFMHHTSLNRKMNVVNGVKKSPNVDVIVEHVLVGPAGIPSCRVNDCHRSGRLVMRFLEVWIDGISQLRYV